MRGKALLFGLNYAHCKQGQLKGCVNDVYMMSKFIQSLLNIPIDIYTDDVDIKSTSYDGIVQKLYDLSIQSVKEDLEFVWIHYSGHGSSQKDTSGDEEDGMDEGLVPSDFERKGILIDDIIHNILASFNPNTKILFICDACHSGSILDLKYTWDTNMKCRVDNKKDYIKSKTLLISGCQDNQTSADAFNLLGDNKSVGALTASILKVLRSNPIYIQNAFKLVQAVRRELKNGNFSQFPNLSSNYNLVQYASLIPLTSSQTQMIPNTTQNQQNQQNQQQVYMPQQSSVPPQQQHQHHQQYLQQPPQQQYLQYQQQPQHPQHPQQSSAPPQQSHQLHQLHQQYPQYQYIVQSNNMHNGYCNGYQYYYYPQPHSQVPQMQVPQMQAQNTRDISHVMYQNNQQSQQQNKQYFIVQLPSNAPRRDVCQMQL